ncbi:MAG: alpha/beta hydrolase [Pseudomonadota bacterium]
MRSNIIDFEFGQLHYTHSMSGKDTTLLLLHAFHSSAVSYQSICALLEDQFNLVCLDFPGHGLSAHVDCHQYAWYYSMEGFTAVLMALIERLELSNYYIIGDSVGGNCAIRVMNTLHNLAGLVLMGTVQARSVDMLFSLHHQTSALELLFQKERSQEEDQVVTAAYVNPHLNEGKAFQLMTYDVQHTDPNCREFFAKQLETQQWVDELQLVQDATVPLIYILGEDDGFINSSYYKYVLIETGLKDSQIHLLKNVRHVPQLDAPQTTAKLICDFIKP